LGEREGIHQGEYWLFSLILASYKKRHSRAVPQPQPQIQRNLSGYLTSHW